MQRITLNITEKQHKALKERALQTGVQQSEQIRRCLNFVLFSDNRSDAWLGQSWIDKQIAKQKASE
jgi:hypothetical protein